MEIKISFPKKTIIDKEVRSLRLYLRFCGNCIFIGTVYFDNPFAVINKFLFVDTLKQTEKSKKISRFIFTYFQISHSSKTLKT